MLWMSRAPVTGCRRFGSVSRGRVSLVAALAAEAFSGRADGRTTPGAIRPSRTRIALMRSVVSDVGQLGAGGADGRGERRETKPAEAPRPAVGARVASYDDCREPMDDADLIEMERAGRRCGVCRSGRGWRRFEVVRPSGRVPVVLCGSCRARFGDDLPVGRKPAPEPAPPDASAVLPPKPRAEKGQAKSGRDRVRASLREMPGSFSTAMVARAAGLTKTRRSLGCNTSSDAGRSIVWATVGRPDRPLTPSPWQSIVFRRGRATFGSLETERGSARAPPSAPGARRSRSLGPASRGRLVSHRST